MVKLPPQRLYYSISEVADLLGEEQYVLRYWEKEFPLLRPQKNRAGNRAYSPRDIAIVQAIHKLLREERYTISGAKELLKYFDPETGKFTEEAYAKPLKKEENSATIREAPENGFKNSEVEQNNGVTASQNGEKMVTLPMKDVKELYLLLKEVMNLLREA
ncbi:MAG: MerR family transcriptional regulator [Bacteroidota bacterium]